MNADELNKLPRYIEEPYGSMWRIPEDFAVAAHENIFVRLSDVLSLVEEENKYGKK